MLIRFFVEMINKSTGTKQFVSFDEQIISEFNFDINENWFDKFEPNQLTVSVLNGQLGDGLTRFEFILNDNGTVEIKDRKTGLYFINNGKCYFELSYDNNSFKRFFTGIIDGLPKLTIDEISLVFNCFDYMKLLENTKAQTNVYVNKTFYFIIEDMLKQVQNRLTGYGTNGGNITYTILIGSENPTIEYFIVEEDSKLLDVIKDLAKSVGGKFYFNEFGNVVFNCGAYSQLETTSTGIYLKKENLVSLNINQTKEYDIIEIKFKEYKPEKEMVEIFNPTKDDKTITVPPEGLPKDCDDYYIDFSGYYVSKIQNYNQIYISTSWNVKLDKDVYNSNINSDGYLKTPSKLKLKFNNLTKNLPLKMDGYIYGLVIKGNIFTLAESVYLYPEINPDQLDDKNKLTIDSRTICNKNMASKVGKFLYEFKNTTIDCEVGDISLLFNNNFIVGKIITINFPKFGINNKNFVINRIKFDGTTLNLTLRLPYSRYIQGNPEPQKTVITKYVELPKSDLSVYFNKTLYYTNFDKYTYYVQNLLGTFGSFEYDSNGYGLADGWYNAVPNKQIINGVQILSATVTSPQTYYISRTLNILANNKYFVRRKIRATRTSNTDGGLGVMLFYKQYVGIDEIFYQGQRTNFNDEYTTITATNNYDSVFIYVCQDWIEQANGTYTIELDNIIIVNLTSMGELPQTLKQFFSTSEITRWEHLATSNNITALNGVTKTGNDWLNDLIPYVKSEYPVPVFWYPE